MIAKSTFTVGRFVCAARFDTDKNRLSFEWDPDVPKFGELSRTDLQTYTTARNTFVGTVARELGIKVLMVD